jgi:DNA-binding beta-propeller fold protein YncE
MIRLMNWFYIFIVVTFTVVISVSEVTAAFFVDTSNGDIVTFNEHSGKGYIFAPFQPDIGMQWPRSIAIREDDQIFVSSQGYSCILQIDPKDGTNVKIFVAPGSGGLYAPTGLAFGPDGNLYVASSNHNILRYDGSTGSFIDVFVETGSGGLGSPKGIIFGPDGNLYVSSWGNILRYDGKTGKFMDLFIPSGSGGLDISFDLAFGPDGNLYISNWYRDNVLMFDGNSGDFIEAVVPSGSNGLSYPMGLGFDKNGNLYIANYGGGNILKYDGRRKQPTTINMPNNSRPCYLSLDRPLRLHSESGK